MNSFQTIVLGIFGFFIIAGLIVISMVKAQNSAGAKHIALWGSISSASMQPLLEDFFDSNTLAVSYREVAPDAFDKTLIEALASGQGPDMVILPAELLLRYLDKLVVIPYATYTERQFKDAFIQEGDLFLLPDGIVALPFAVDPLLMYWNRDLLDEAGVTAPPKFWNEFLLLANRLTRRGTNGAITRSAVGLGDYRSITSAKEILGALLLQAGSSGEKTWGELLGRSGAHSVINFYTEFANPSKPVYSWNRSLVSSRQMFLSSRLGVYFGLGSEYTALRQANPNLNFDIAAFPRPQGSDLGITLGKLFGLAVLRASPNPSVALQVALTLSSSEALSRFAALTNYPPVRRDLLGQVQSDAYRTVLYDAAIKSRGFLDRDPTVSASVLQDMIESITSGRAYAAEAASRAASQLR